VIDLTNEERETHLNQSAANRREWEMATDDPIWIARMEKLGIVPDRKRGQTYFYTIPDNQITVRRKRVMTDDQRSALSERARKMSRKQVVQA